MAENDQGCKQDFRSGVSSAPGRTCAALEWDVPSMGRVYSQGHKNKDCVPTCTRTNSDVNICSLDRFGATSLCVYLGMPVHNLPPFEFILIILKIKEKDRGACFGGL